MKKMAVLKLMVWVCILSLGSSCVHTTPGHQPVSPSRAPSVGQHRRAEVPRTSGQPTFPFRRAERENREGSFIFVPTPRNTLPQETAAGKEIHRKKKTGKKEKATPKAGVEKPKGGGGEGIKINVENMPLNEFINLVFSKTLKKSFYIDKTVANMKIPVTLKMEAPISPQRFKQIVREILYRCNVEMKEKNGFLLLTPSVTRKVVKPVPPFFVGRTLPPEVMDRSLIGAIVPLYYINARIYLPIVKRACLSAQGKAERVPSTSAMLIVDGPQEVKAALELLRLFDQPAFVSQKAVLVKLDYISPKDMKKRLAEILKAQGVPVAFRPGDPGIALIPLPELNSLFVVSPKKEWINLIRFWKEKLDDPVVLGDQPRLFVYYPKNRRAKDLASVITKLGTFGFSVASAESKIVTQKARGTKRPGPPVPPPLRIQTTQLQRTGKEKVKIVVDEGRNALVILATPMQFQEIKKVLGQLDVLPKEVMIKVTIAEVTLSDQLQYGVEWYLRHSTTTLAHEIGTMGRLGIGTQGLFYSVIQETRRFQAVINAFAEKKLIKILSSPHLVVLDNKEAMINVGTEVPIVTSESSASDIQNQKGSSILRNIEYRSTGVILHIKPTINSGGILTLDVHQEVSEAQTNNISPDISSPLILTRDVQTSVVLKSGMTLLLGGLIKNNKSETKDQVPLLGDIPILGNLFKTTSNSVDKTELIVELTPYIIGSVGEAKAVTNKFRSLIKWYKKE